MTAFDLVASALRAIRAQKLRASLTALGVVIGVGAVIAMLSIGAAAQAAVAARIGALGTNLVVATPVRQQVSGITQSSNVASLTYADAVALAQRAPHINATAPELTGEAQLVANGQNTRASVDGTTAEWPMIRDYQLAQGRFLTQADLSSRAQVVVLGATPAATLFPDGNAVGSSMILNGLPFTVVGVMGAKGAVGPANQDSSVWVPLTTAQVRLFGSAALRDIDIMARSGSAVGAAEREATSILRTDHGLSGAASNDFSLASQDAALSAASGTARTFTVLLAGVAAVSLLVGGIGIMNIMLVTVTERTREIGLRKALGATDRAILAQFALEAVGLSVAGGLAGVVVGIGASAAIAHFAGWHTLVQPGSVALSLGFATAVGVFFGFYPSRRAARLDPITALRYE